MKRIMPFLCFIALLFFAAVNTSSASLLPTINFNGTFATTAGNGTGSLTLNTFISKADYQYDPVTNNYPSTNVNIPGVESIIGKTVVLTGAARTGDYSFNGDPADPEDVVLSIVDLGNISDPNDDFTYFSASLSNVNFTTDGLFYYLNPTLDGDDPTTLNLSNIFLNTDEAHPSKYIQELANALVDYGINGMKMTLFIPFFNGGDFTGDSSGYIVEGLVDGIQAPANVPPTADAGENISVSSEGVSLITILGTAADGDGDALQYRWFWNDEYGNEIVLLDWTDAAGIDGNECTLDLNAIPPDVFYLGENIVYLDVKDGETISSDSMILTIENSAPNPAPVGSGTYEIYSDVTLGGQVSDYDGDLLSYEWIKGGEVLFFGEITPPAGGDAVFLPSNIISDLALGVHTITLQVYDGTNDPVSSEITVEIIDTTEPTLAPEADNVLLWPPNHVMVDIVIIANANDNSGEVTLSASVSSNEPEDGLGDGDMSPDWTQVVINQETGEIYLQVRRERSGSGEGRVYTVTVTATDITGNSSSADVNIRIPHDKRKK